jgi:hypothetical protein
VAARTVQLTVDVRIDGDEISGRANDGGGQPKPFRGWLGLLAALGDLLATPPPDRCGANEISARSTEDPPNRSGGQRPGGR